MQPLIIVERHELQLYVYLCEDYADVAEIILDRRHAGDRRSARGAWPDDRRRSERRAHDISQALAISGWVIVRRPR